MVPCITITFALSVHNDTSIDPHSSKILHASQIFQETNKQKTATRSNSWWFRPQLDTISMYSDTPPAPKGPDRRAQQGALHQLSSHTDWRPETSWIWWRFCHNLTAISYFKWSIFRCYVSLPECKWFIHWFFDGDSICKSHISQGCWPHRSLILTSACPKWKPEKVSCHVGKVPCALKWQRQNRKGLFSIQNVQVRRVFQSVPMIGGASYTHTGAGIFHSNQAFE